MNKEWHLNWSVYLKGYKDLSVQLGSIFVKWKLRGIQRDCRLYPEFKNLYGDCIEDHRKYEMQYNIMFLSKAKINKILLFLISLN